MERCWPVLRYCDNHWKAHEIATANYPQWHKNHHKKKLGAEGNKHSDKPVQKKCRAVIEDDNDAAFESESDNNIDGPMPEDTDVDMGMGEAEPNQSMSFLVPQDGQEGSREGTSRP